MDSPAKSGGSVVTAMRLLAITIAVLWVVEGADQWILSDRLQRHGIHPRQIDGLDGVLWAPFLHAGWGHLASNTVPLAALGALVGLRGLPRLLIVTAAAMFIGGGLTWLFGSSGNHVGASGIVFGFFGALLGAAIFERRPLAVAPALVAIMMYSGILVGFVPQAGVSWEGHLFGFLGGLLVARTIADRTPRFAWQADDWVDDDFL